MDTATRDIVDFCVDYCLGHTDPQAVLARLVAMMEHDLDVKESLATSQLASRATSPIPRIVVFSKQGDS